MIDFCRGALLLCAVAVMCGGCQGSSSASHERSVRVVYKANGDVIFESGVHSEAEAKAPGAATQPSPSVATGEGANAASSGSWEPLAIDWASKNTSLIYPIIAGLLLIAGVFLAWKRQWFAAACAGIAAAAAAGMLYAGPWLGLLVVLAAGAAGVWVAAKWWRSREKAKEGQATAAKLLNEASKSGELGPRAQAATAVLRETNPAMDEAFEEQKKTKVVVVGAPKIGP